MGDQPELSARLEELVREGKLEEARDLVSELHPSDLADLIESMDLPDRVALLRVLPRDLASESLAEMEEEEEPEEILAALEPSEGAELIRELDYDDAVDLVAELEPEDRARLLAALPIEEAGEIRGLLRYEEDTAGGIMDTQLVRVFSHLTAAEAIEEVRRQGREVDNFYTVFVVDEGFHLLGSVTLADLILADPDRRVAELVEPVPAVVHPEDDQEKAGRLMSRYNLVSLPVVDQFGVLLGRITFDDVLDVLEAEQTEDILRLAGTSQGEELRATWWEAAKKRLPWLLLNLGTASLGASVIYHFTETIADMVILAVVMPVVAGLGGNAGTQALAVTVRRLALDAEARRNRWSILGKEFLVGAANGAVVGAFAAVAAALLDGHPLLGLVVWLAMMGNQTVGSLAGSFFPTLLDRLGIDPAVASSVFVTALTDMTGFLFLLGLGSAILL